MKAAFAELRKELDFANKRIEELYDDNQRLRWRHPLTFPDWNDLPFGTKDAIIKCCAFYSDEYCEGDFAVNLYRDIKKAALEAWEAKTA